MAELYLPVLSHFQNGNVWTASVGVLRYRVTPGEEGLTAECWQGPWCRELSQVEEEMGFPLSEEGIEALRSWVVGWAERINSRPRETLEESIARRDALLARQTAREEGAEQNTTA